MLKFKLVSLFLFLFILSSVAQVSIKGTAENTYNITNDNATIDARARSIVADSSGTVFDTTALKLSVGKKAYLLSTPGGWYEMADSSDYPDNHVTSFNHPTSGKVWVSLDYKQNGIIYLNSSYSDAYLQKAFNIASNNSHVLIKAQPGDYSTNANFTIVNAGDITFDLYDTTWDMNGYYFDITGETTSSSFYYTGVGKSYLIGNIAKYGYQVQVRDTTTLTLSKGDQIMVADSVGPSVGRRNGMINYFSKWSYSAPNYYMNFMEPAQFPVLTSDSLLSPSDTMFTMQNIANKNIIINDAKFRNADIRLSCFTNVFLNNIDIRCTLSSANQPDWAFSITYCKNVFGTNIVGTDYNKGGAGYIFSTRYTSYVTLVNSAGHDNWHFYTSTGDNYGYSRLVRLINCDVTYSDDFNKQFHAYDSHSGILNFELINCSADNANGFVQLRSRGLKLRNCTATNSTVGIIVSGIPVYDSTKTVIDVDNFTLKNVTQLITVAASTSKIEKILLSNVHVDNRNFNNLFYGVYGRADTYIDTLVIKNSEFLGYPGEDNSRMFAISEMGGSFGDYGIDYAMIDNIYVENFHDIFYYVSRPAIEKLLLKNSLFKGFTNFVVVDLATGGSSTTEAFPDYNIRNNVFDGGKYWWVLSNIDTVAFGDFRAINNDFYNIGELFRQWNYSVSDNFTFNNNEFWNAPYNTGNVLALGAMRADTVNIIENKVYEFDVSEINTLSSLLNADYYSTLGANTGFISLSKYTGSYPFIRVVDNKFFNGRGASKAISIDSAYVDIEENILNVSGSASNSYFDDCSGYFLGNKLKINGIEIGIEGIGTASDLLIDDNAVYQTSGSVQGTGIDVTGGTFGIGLNRFFQLTTQVDTAGVAAYDSVRVFIGDDEQ